MVEERPGKIKDFGDREAKTLFRGDSSDRSRATILTRIKEFDALIGAHNVPSRDAFIAMETKAFCDLSSAAGRNVQDEIRSHRAELLESFVKPKQTKPFSSPTDQGQRDQNAAALVDFKALNEAYYYQLLHHMYRFLAENHLPATLQNILRNKWTNLRHMGPNETATSYIGYVKQQAKFINEVAEAQNNNVLNIKLLMGDAPPDSLLLDDAGTVALKVLPNNSQMEVNIQTIDDDAIKVALMTGHNNQEFVQTFRMLTNTTLNSFILACRQNSDHKVLTRPPGHKGKGKGKGKGDQGGRFNGPGGRGGGTHSVDNPKKWQRQNAKGSGRGGGSGGRGRGQGPGDCWNIQNNGTCNRTNCRFKPCCGNTQIDLEAQVASMSDEGLQGLLAALQRRISAPAPAPARGRGSLFDGADIHVIDDQLDVYSIILEEEAFVNAIGDPKKMTCAIWQPTKGEWYEVEVPNASGGSTIEVAFLCNGKYVKCRALLDTGSTITVMNYEWWEQFLKGTSATKVVYTWKNKKHFTAANKSHLKVEAMAEIQMNWTPNAKTTHKVFLAHNLAKDFILGNDLLVRLGAQVDLNVGQVKLTLMNDLTLEILE